MMTLITGFKLHGLQANLPLLRRKVLKQKQNLCAFRERLHRKYGHVYCMYEVISTAVDTIENDETDEGSLLIFGGRQRAFVVVRFTRQWRTCLLFVYCEETNKPNEPLEA